jgi:DNA-binding CsgD family transcriptional regulator
MILTPLDINAAGRAKVLQSLSLLTPTEREIASQLLCGDSVEAVARHRRLSTETVRWHIRNMIGKTGARNLADLHRILALLLPI